MNIRRFVLLPVVILTLIAGGPLVAQDSTAAGKSALTYDQFPYSFTAENPLKPVSSVLLRFNTAVNPDAVEGGMKLYDKPNERFAAIVAKRPTLEIIQAMTESSTAEGIVIENFVLISPASPLPLGGTWFINATAGLASANGSHEIIEGRLDYLGELEAFTVSEIVPSNEYDSSLDLIIRHNKGGLGTAFDAKRLADFIKVSPQPEEMEILPGSYQILITGKFD
ncbi:MAG: hypothetical protein ABL994_05180 [Verrucomicrobiales bacterium]